MMKSFSFVAVVLLSLLLGICSGFVVPSGSALNVRQSQQSGGMQMFFGGGAKKAAATSKGIVVKVQQKTGFKETELVLKGKTNLRKALLDNKIDVYPLQVSSCFHVLHSNPVQQLSRTCANTSIMYSLCVNSGTLRHTCPPVLFLFFFLASAKLTTHRLRPTQQSDQSFA